MREGDGDGGGTRRREKIGWAERSTHFLSSRGTEPGPDEGEPNCIYEEPHLNDTERERDPRETGGTTRNRKPKATRNLHECPCLDTHTWFNAHDAKCIR